MNTIYEEIRPWGKFEVLSETDKHKIKRLTVLPNHRLSYQMHEKRTEVWTVVEGVGHLTIGEPDQIIKAEAGSVHIIPVGCKHRIENKGPETLVIMEVQQGSYLGEDDIIRFEDDYGR